MTKKILIIDDEQAFCNLLEEMILGLGDFTVNSYTSGTEALANIQSFKPDAVFVDMLMPENDGGSVIKAVREKLSPTPLIVMVTGMVAEDETANISYPILAKPVNKESLKKVLSSL